VQPTGFSRGPQPVVEATPRPNGTGQPGRAASSYPPPQPLHPATTTPQQAVQPARPPTANKAASHARTKPQATSQHVQHINTNRNNAATLARNAPDGSSRSSSDYTNQVMQHRVPSYSLTPSHPPQVPQNDTLKSPGGYSHFHGQPQVQQKAHAQPPPNYQNATANFKHIVIPTASSSPFMPPPPTPTDVLQNSSLFGPIPDLPRPTSSKGRSNNHANDICRISIGDGLPVQPDTLVTPGSMKRTPSAYDKHREVNNNRPNYRMICQSSVDNDEGVPTIPN
jgi:hypothetical protein